MEAPFSALHAFGLGFTTDSLDVLELPDSDGSGKEHVLHAVGQHVALLRVEDGEMKVTKPLNLIDISLVLA